MTDERWAIFASVIFAMMMAFIIILVLLQRPAHGKELVIASTYNDGTVDANGMTVAHPTLKHGTRLTVSHGHRKIMVTVNDTGPAPWTKRKLDLTPAVNRYLRCYGLCKVVIESWPPLPKPKPEILTRDVAIQWGEE